MIPRRLCHPGPQQRKRWLVSIVLGGTLLGVLIREAGRNKTVHSISQPALDAERYWLDIDAAERHLKPQRNPDRADGREARRQLQLLRQCASTRARETLQSCVATMLDGWRKSPQKLSAFLEALRFQERQQPYTGEPGQIVETLQKMLPEARDQIEIYSLWFQVQRRRAEGMSQLSVRSSARLQPRYLGLMLQADLAARQGLRAASFMLYESAAESFLKSMLEKMRKSESITLETYNQNQDQKDLARLYLQQGWWPEAEKLIYGLAEQEPADQIVLGLMEQLRRRSSQSQAG